MVLAILAAAAAFFGAGPRRGPGRPLAPGEPRHGEEIVVCGALYSIGTPVVLWTDPGGYDAYALHRRDRPGEVLPESPAPGCATPERTSKRTRRASSASGGSGTGTGTSTSTVVTLEDLQEAVSQLVIHYDQAYTSRNCFHILHDIRGLSVHFMLDLDGTLYQTCDLVERCRHAREANDRSIGVEVAHPGALEDGSKIAGLYRRDERGLTFLALPSWLGPEPVRTPGFVPRPARPEPIRGKIHGRDRTQYDFTDPQYEALGRLAGALARIFPRLRLEAPRNPGGEVRDRIFDTPEEAAAFQGVVGHYHLQSDKYDPGPAFDWERFLEAARR